MIGEKAIGEITHRYRELERESSSLLLDHDSRLVLGRYEEAAYYALQAGRHRASMGKILFDAGDRVRASEDWLSASQCFLLAANGSFQIVIWSGPRHSTPGMPT